MAIHSLTQDYPAILLDKHEAPCLSLYQPTHRQHPDNVQDPIRFRNLVKQLEASLRQRYASRDIAALLRPFDALAQDEAFWNHAADGLAVVATPDSFRVYRLQRSVAELAVVADSFHTKPLMRIMQSADRYQILGLSRQAFMVLEGNRDALDLLPPIEGVAHEASDLSGRGTDVREGAHRAFGPAGAGGVTAQGGAVKRQAGGVARHGTDVKQDAVDRETELFFRAVDQAVLKHCSQPSGLPLILAALPQHHHLFRSLSANPLLMNEAIDVHPDAMSNAELRERAWELMQPHYLERLAGITEAFGAANASGRGADEPGTIARAAAAGRVATLLIEADRLIPGRIAAASGTIADADLSNPQVDDVLDDLGELVLRQGGEVIIVPAERMPTRTGAAATYRF